MVQCQAVNVAPWKIIGWFPRVVKNLNGIEESLASVLEGDAPNKDLLPKLAKHWEELSHERAEDCCFQDTPVLEGWLVVGQEKVDEQLGRATQSTVYNWSARTPSECIEDLLVLCRELKEGLQHRFDRIVPAELTTLFKAFDLEEIVTAVSSFRFEHGKVSVSLEDRIAWERYGMEEFSQFFKHVCSLPQVLEYVKCNMSSNLLVHNSQLVANCLKNTVKKMVWENLGNVAQKMFVTEKGEFVVEFDRSQLVHMSVVETHSLKKYFQLNFSSGVSVIAHLNEEFIISTFYTNVEIYQSLGQDACIVLDVALASSGCEAIVEGFYSVVKAQAQSGGQSNKVLTERAVVDWVFPNPLGYPSTILKISELFTKGCKRLGVRKHRPSIFFDARQRAAGKYNVSKVVDRHMAEKPRCPFLIKDDLEE